MKIQKCLPVIVIVVVYLFERCSPEAMPSTNVMQSTSTMTTTLVVGSSQGEVVLPTDASKTALSAPNNLGTQMSVMSPTLTISPSDLFPTWTPLPTLSRLDAETMVYELLMSNAGCELPCYWGITPGETSWKTAEQWLATFVYRISSGHPSTYSKNNVRRSINTYRTYVNVPGYSDSISASYGVSNGVVEIIAVHQRGTEERYDLHNLLNLLGKPGEALLQILPDTPAGKPWYGLYLFYPDQGVIALYDAEAQLIDENVVICPMGIAPELILVQPGSQSLDWMKRYTHTAARSSSPPPINEIPGMSIDSFYDQMIIPDSCLSISLSSVE